MTGSKKVSVPGKGSLRWMSDPEREETTVKAVRETESGYEISREDGWMIWLDKEHGVVPKAGDPIIFFGRGIGSVVRGIVVDGKLAFYRTAEEQVEHAKIESYGTDAQEWLNRWDAGKGVWTIQMGGLSAGYDQSINIVVAETVRALLALSPEIEEVDGRLSFVEGMAEALDKALESAVLMLGLSGAQYGAGKSLGVQIWLHGPVKVMEMYPEDRKTQASKRWPVLGLSKDDFERIADIIETNDLITVADDRRLATRIREIANTGG